MTIKEFVDGYKNATDKAKYMSKHMVTDYIPYETKVAISRGIVANAYSDSIDNHATDSTQAYLLFIVAVYNGYFDLQFTKGKIIEEFNELEKEGINDRLSSVVGPDYERLSTVFNMVTDDYVEDHRSVGAVIANLVKLFNSLSDEIDKYAQKVKDAADTGGDSNE